MGSKIYWKLCHFLGQKSIENQLSFLANYVGVRIYQGIHPDDKAEWANEQTSAYSKNARKNKMCP